MATFAALSLRASRATGAARIARLLGAPFSSQAAQMPNQEAGAGEPFGARGCDSDS